MNDDKKKALYRSGMCDAYAIALSRTLNKPIFVVRGLYWDDVLDDMSFEDAHLVVKVGNDKFKDVDGIKSSRELKQQSYFTNKIDKVVLKPISEEDAMYSFASMEGVSEKDIEEARRYIAGGSDTSSMFSESLEKYAVGDEVYFFDLSHKDQDILNNYVNPKYDIEIIYDVIPKDDVENIKFWLNTKIKSEGPPPDKKLIKQICKDGKINNPVLLDLDFDVAIEGRHRLFAAAACKLDVPVLMISRREPVEGSDLIESLVSEELIGTSGGVRYFQMGGSLPKKLYNRKNGKGTKEVGSAKFRGKTGKSFSKKIEDDLSNKKRWYTNESFVNASKFMYHVTDVKNLKNIIKNGLRINTHGGLTTEFGEWAHEYYGMRPIYLSKQPNNFTCKTKKCVTLKVDISEYDLVADLQSLVDFGAYVPADNRPTMYWENGYEPDLMKQFLDENGEIDIIDLLAPGKATEAAIRTTKSAVVMRNISPKHIEIIGSKKKNFLENKDQEASPTNFFDVEDDILFGKYKNKKGKIAGFSKDEKGNPTVKIEPTPKGRKKDVEMGLYKIWKQPAVEIKEEVERKITFEKATSDWFYACLDDRDFPEKALDVMETYAVEVYEKIYRTYNRSNCGVVSDMWRRLFKKHGIEAKIIEGFYNANHDIFTSHPLSTDHVWLEIDGCVFDPTAGQFEGHIDLNNYWLDDETRAYTKTRNKLKESSGKKLKLSGNKKYHFSSKPLKNIRSLSQETIGFTAYDKPNGFWYSCGDDWLKFLETEMPYELNSKIYVYEVDIDDSKILKMSTASDLDAFTEKYHVKDAAKLLIPNLSYTKQTIDWDMVAKEYSGVEICPYIGSRRLQLSWYYGWDVASGCIWNRDAVKSVKLIGAIKEKRPVSESQYYHGTTATLLPGEYILPPSETGKISEKGRKKNLSKVFMTKDMGSAKIYAGRAKHSLGGRPSVYLVEPVGEVETITNIPGTSVFMAPKAKVVKKLD